MDTQIGGLCFFNVDHSLGVLVTEGDAQTRLDGTWDESGLTAEAEGYALVMKRVTPKGERHPVAKGTLTIAGAQYPVAGFLNKTKEGRLVIGLAVDEPRPESIDCPW